jgi:hypothetical protein
MAFVSLYRESAVLKNIYFFIFFAAAFFLKIHVKLVGGQTVC